MNSSIFIQTIFWVRINQISFSKYSNLKLPLKWALNVNYGRTSNLPNWKAAPHHSEFNLNIDKWLGNGTLMLIQNNKY